MRTEQDLISAIDLYGDTIKRICILYLKNQSDTEDIFQNVFLKYYNSSTHFENEEHLKAFLIRIAINECKDLLKSFFRKNTLPITEINELSVSQNLDINLSVREAVLKLPDKNKIVIYLHYFEGYTSVEISKMLNKNVNTIYTLLSRGREMLKTTIGGDEHEW